MKIARVIGGIGRALVVAGLLLLFYTAYLLWGTSLYTRNAQSDLAKRVKEKPLVTSKQASMPGQIPAARPATPPKLGDPLFTIVVPKIGVRSVVVEMAEGEVAEREALKKGPGHFPGRPYPGEDGNVPISGHRTTFGAPFYRLDEMEPGDAVSIESGPARYKYAVTEKLIVAPEQIEVIENRGRNELTLTTCNPRFSATQRLIVHANYLGAELIESSPPGRDVAADPSLKTQPAVPRDVLVLLALSAATALLAVGLSKRFRLAAVWAAVVLIAGVGLWTTVFPQVLRLMPANY